MRTKYCISSIFIESLSIWWITATHDFTIWCHSTFIESLSIMTVNWVLFFLIQLNHLRKQVAMQVVHRDCTFFQNSFAVFYLEPFSLSEWLAVIKENINSSFIYIYIVAVHLYYGPFLNYLKMSTLHMVVEFILKY